MKITMAATCADDLEKIIHYAKALEVRGETDVEVVLDYRNETKKYLITEDIANRYKVCRTTAQGIVHAIKDYCGDTLGKGKILPAELLAWENKSLDKPAWLNRGK